MLAFAKLSAVNPESLSFFVAFFPLCLCTYVCPPVLGKIRSAVGSAQLLMSQKFQQFYWLCQQNLVSIFFVLVNKNTASTYTLLICYTGKTQKIRGNLVDGLLFLRALCRCSA